MGTNALKRVYSTHPIIYYVAASSIQLFLLRGQKVAPSEGPNRTGLLVIPVDGSRANFFN
jgi:hypothetical protein